MKIFLTLLLGFAVLFRFSGSEIGSDFSSSDIPAIEPANVNKAKIDQIVDFISALLEKDDVTAAKMLIQVLQNDSSGELPLLLLIQKFKNPEAAKACLPELLRLASENPSALKLNLAALILNPDKNLKLRSDMALAALATVKDFDALDTKTLLAAIRMAGITGEMLAEQTRFSEGDKLYERLSRNRTVINNAEFIEAAARFYRKMELNSASQEEEERSTAQKNLYTQIFSKNFANPTDPDQALQLAKFYEELGAYQTAIEVLETQLRKTPEHHGIQSMLGALYVRIGNNQAALELRQSLAATFPDHLLIQLHYGESLVFTGNFQEAIPVLEKCLKSKKHEIYLKLLLGHAHYGTGNYREALKYLAGINDFHALRLQVDALNQLKEYGRAVNLLENSEQEFGEKIGLPFYMMFLNTGEKSRDVELVNKYGEIIKDKFGWDNPEIANALGYIYVELNVELELAEKLIRKALAQKPDSMEIIDSMAWMLYRKNEFEDARTYIDR
ncbi:MAG: tetratricopeptide repeat protein, partial [Lentisphaerae bacterium]|nr:tetratricopeptide repeat protein [Lentisphaerota bacterium]